MITVALTHLLRRNVHLSVAEALAVAQTASDGPGDPAVDNIELSSDGSVRCVNRGGEPSIGSLAALLEALLPQSGVPGPLRYAVARAAGTVAAPPFDSFAEFRRALTRFETGERRDVVRHLLSRAAPARPVARAVVAEPAGDVILQRPQAVIESTAGRSRWRVAIVAAALLLSGLAGFAAERAWVTRHAVRKPGPARHAEEVPPGALSPKLSRGSTVFFQAGRPHERRAIAMIPAAGADGRRTGAHRVSQRPRS